MRVQTILTTLNFYPNRNPRLRLFALWYFTCLISIWTVLGHLVLGFEQSYAHPIAGVITAVSLQVLLEWVDARAVGRTPRFAGGWMTFVNFLPAAIIPGLACAMLIYPNTHVWPVAFAAGLSIASKVLFRAPVAKGQTQHIFNPSNIGITVTFFAFPWVGLAPPYHFTENVTGAWDWIIPGVILIAGVFVHAKFTGRLPLVLAWIGGFAAQGLIRAALFGIPIIVPFVPVTSAAFILFTLFMIPDPATTPIKPWRQAAFGASVAAIYGMLLVVHVVFGLFIALFLTSAVRGIGLYVASFMKRRQASPAEQPIPATAAAARMR